MKEDGVFKDKIGTFERSKQVEGWKVVWRISSFKRLFLNISKLAKRIGRIGGRNLGINDMKI